MERLTSEIPAARDLDDRIIAWMSEANVHSSMASKVADEVDRFCANQLLDLRIEPVRLAVMGARRQEELPELTLYVIRREPIDSDPEGQRVHQEFVTTLARPFSEHVRLQLFNFAIDPSIPPEKSNYKHILRQEAFRQNADLLGLWTIDRDRLRLKKLLRRFDETEGLGLEAVGLAKEIKETVAKMTSR